MSVGMCVLCVFRIRQLHLHVCMYRAFSSHVTFNDVIRIVVYSQNTMIYMYMYESPLMSLLFCLTSKTIYGNTSFMYTHV